MKRIACCLAFLTALAPISLPAQEQVTIRVDAGSRIGPLKPIWAYVGYDEPNYTYMKHGQKLVAELAKMNPVPVYFRAHSLLVTGDGKPNLKWGSTNAYTEDETGRPVYDWKIVDQIFDTYVKVGAKPLVEVGFMPEALSVKPQPYRHHWEPGKPYADIYTGWAYPPRDYNKWAELIRQWVRHSVERYGREEVLAWYWELWNEPDISYWKGTPEEYNKLYDYTVAAIKGVLPQARVGGPATTGPSAPRAAAFLRQFLEHCARGKNYATGGTGSPLDLITYHAKGSPRVVEGHVQMGLGKNLADIDSGLRVIAEFPQFKGLPIILTESDPEGCAACSARVYPQNTYRNGTMYPCYTAVHMSNIFKLADRYQASLEGMMTWAFEFEDQPWFDGFRSLATNGVDKPVLNVFRMAGLMRGDRVKVESSGAVGLDAILKEGVRGRPDIDALASRSERDISVMTWNYHDDDVPAPAGPVRLQITGVPASARRVLVTHYRIDGDHSNSYTVWKEMGSPQQSTPEQYARLEAAGQLELLTSPEWVSSRDGRVELSFALPRQAVSLIQVSW
ncbi:MAG TPA: beta-xylosidase [Blastocatellia bacterium]|nr:beta-xylosidase [Blastocatellia bacterium]